MTEQRDLNETVVAIFDSDVAVTHVTQDLVKAGYRYELLFGRKNQDSYHGGAIGQLLHASRKQQRVVNHLDQALESGAVVISVDTEDRNPSEAPAILQNRGGKFIWMFGEWL